MSAFIPGAFYLEPLVSSRSYPDISDYHAAYSFPGALYLEHSGRISQLALMDRASVSGCFSMKRETHSTSSYDSLVCDRLCLKTIGWLPSYSCSSSHCFQATKPVPISRLLAYRHRFPRVGRCVHIMRAASIHSVLPDQHRISPDLNQHSSPSRVFPARSYELKYGKTHF